MDWDSFWAWTIVVVLRGVRSFLDLCYFGRCVLALVVLWTITTRSIVTEAAFPLAGASAPMAKFVFAFSHGFVPNWFAPKVSKCGCYAMHLQPL